MSDKDLLRFFFKSPDPVQKPVHIRVSADALHLADLRRHVDFLAKKLHLCGSFDKRSSQRADRLISHKKDGVAGIPQIMLQVVFDTARIAHAAGGNNNLAVLVIVDRLGIVAGDGSTETGETQRVDAVHDQANGLLVKAVVHMLFKDRGRLVGKRTVHINLEILMAFHSVLGLDLADEIQHLLSTADCE